MAETEKKRTPVTAKDIEALRASLTAKTASGAHDPYEELRRGRIDTVNNLISGYTEQLADMTAGSDDLEAVAAIFRSLATIKSRATRAINAVPDSALQVADDGLGA